MEHLAGHLNLAQFPGAIECISSLLDTSSYGDQEALHLPFLIGRSKQRNRRSWIHRFLAQENKDGNLKVPESPFGIMFGFSLEQIHKIYGALENDGSPVKHSENGEGIDEDLVLPGLRILEKLAHDRHNCKLICNTKDLLSKAVAPVSSDNLVQDINSNAGWTKVVDGSLKVVSRLMGSPGSTKEEMHSLIAGAANNLEAILDMDMMSNSSIVDLKTTAIEVLTHLVLHHPPSSATVVRRDKLIKGAVHIFITKDWMKDYLKHEQKKIDSPTSSHMEKKMRQAKESASRLKEKAGEALASLSSNSEAFMSFTGSEDFAHRLTELLDSSIRTIKCEISATYTVEVEINTRCRISAAVILKNMRNYVKEPTLCKVLLELLLTQPEASSTPCCWERVTSCIPSGRNDIENPSDCGQYESHTQQCRERRLQAELLSLVAGIRASSNVNFAETLVSQPQPVALEEFVLRVKNMVEENMYATPACLAIQKLTCEMVIELIQHDRNAEVIEKHNIVGTLSRASKMMARLERNMLFAGVDRDCHGVALRPLSSDLAKQAEDLLTQRKQLLGINGGVPAGIP
ncbi:uncharacterized protein [Lolium perenne]|uniref:uncharacterized protein n=1 Tax=Lolium perenne TaxID=4522 RepID=UPI0021EB0AF7|nr:uncharacterized protein LOC127337183 [Lolium perenne]